MHELEALIERLLAVRSQGFRAFKIGWGPFGRHNTAKDEAIVRAACETIGAEALLMVDAGASDPFWPQNYNRLVLGFSSGHSTSFNPMSPRSVVLAKNGGLPGWRKTTT